MKINACRLPHIRLLLLGVGALAPAFWGGTAKATACISDPSNIVADCGFDTENTMGGTVIVTATNPTTWTFAGNSGIDSSNPLSLPNNAFLGVGGTVSQTLALTQGQTYSITFWLLADANTLSDAADFDFWNYTEGLNCAAAINVGDLACFDPSVAVSFDGSVVGTAFGDDGRLQDGDYAEYTFTGTAADNSGSLTFTGSQDPNAPGTWYLDEVDVDCTSCTTTATSIPEPGDLSIFLTALAGWYSIRKWRRII